MKLVNRTNYPTADLRAALVAVHAEEAKRRGRLATWNRLIVTVARRLRRGHVSGHAYYHGTKAHLTIPAVTISVTQLVAIWLHELQHLYGICHSDMAPAVRNCAWRDGQLDAWATEAYAALDGRSVLVETTIAPLTDDEKARARDAQREAKLGRIVARLGAWETKRKRAERAIAKLRKQQRYYERTIAAAAGRSS